MQRWMALKSSDHTRSREDHGNHLHVPADCLLGSGIVNDVVEAGMDGFLVKPDACSEVLRDARRAITTEPEPNPRRLRSPALNWMPATLWGLCGGDKRLLAELIRLFQEEFAQTPGAASKPAVRSANNEQLRTGAPRVRGLVASFPNRRQRPTPEQMASMDAQARPRAVSGLDLTVFRSCARSSPPHN